jgi:predicted ATPase/DNA-binding CsgD family transcriptional regulator/transcriptional regulator with XRE-family HTH domain
MIAPVVASFATLLRQHRIAAGLSQEELAERAGLSARAISDIERGVHRAPYRETVRLLSAALSLADQSHAAFVGSVRRQRGPPGSASPDLPTASSLEWFDESTSLAAAHSTATKHDVARAQGNLPRSLTSLIGRERETAAVRGLLMREPEYGCLVTLTGPPGTGKTRLALRVAAVMSGDIADGVWFIPLASIRDPNLVAAVIARALSVHGATNQSLLERLISFLGPRSALLVLDNFEQILAAAPVIASLLVRCPRLKILATSRAALRLNGEREFIVPPLTLPDLAIQATAESLMQSEAIELFVTRAQAVQADFKLTSETAGAVAGICHRLDDLPLAIELAAARSKVLGPEALLLRLNDRLSLLTTGPRDYPVRQRTLRAALDWSYELLDSSEQVLFRRLGVFVGGCTLETAAAVCDADGDLRVGVLDGLASLVDKSLLRQVPDSDGEPRFRMLESVRDYAWDRLLASGELRRIRQQHARVFLGIASRAEAELRGPQQTAWRDRLEREMPNLRGALRWSLDGGDLERGMRAAAGLWMFWFVRGHVAEGRQWLEAFLERPNSAAPAAARGKALFTAGILAFYQSDHAAGRRFHEEGLALQRQLGDQGGIAYALFGLGQHAFSRGDLAAAHELHEDALVIGRALHDPWQVALSLANLGNVVEAQGDHALARAVLEESLAIRRRIGDGRAIAATLVVLGHLVQGQGEYQMARAFYEESLTIIRQLDDTWSLVHLLAGLAGLAAAEGRSTLMVRLAGATSAARESSGCALLPGWSEQIDLDLRRAQGALAAASEEGCTNIADLIAAALAMSRQPHPTLPGMRARTQMGKHGSVLVPLTRREQEVAVLIARGYTNREIATELVITQRTSAAHVEHILRKLEMTSRAQVAAWAAPLQFVLPGP